MLIKILANKHLSRQSGCTKNWGRAARMSGPTLFLIYGCVPSLPCMTQWWPILLPDNQCRLVMSLKRVISVAFFSFCFLGKAALSNCQVPVVNRNDIDSFLVKGGCSDNPNICPRSSTCHSKSGLCLCDSRKPTYRSPAIITDGAIGLKYGSSYGCVNNRFIDSYGMAF